MLVRCNQHILTHQGDSKPSTHRIW